MAQRPKRKKGKKLAPNCKVLFVHSDRLEWLDIQAITPATVGQKAFGLSSLPPFWTLPFFSISAKLLEEFSAQGESSLDNWMGSILAGIDAIELRSEDRLLVRSSGCGEDINLRGALHTVEGDVASIRGTLINCLTKLSNENTSAKDSVPLLIQKACSPLRCRGHLSNERRCYEESRDWIGEIESVDPEASAAFQINLRRWREQVLPNPTGPLNCTLSPWISETLKAPAEWAHRQAARVHFEWVWDGINIYLVQADEETTTGGLDPVAEFKARKYQPIIFTPTALRLVTVTDAERFAKIRNVFIYYKLKLPTAPLYILDNIGFIEQLGKGEIPPQVAEDIGALVQGSLVIRMDLDTDDLGKRQLLPRTPEVRSRDEALKWLITQCQLLCRMDLPGAFLFHNFIPSIASAFAYAVPKEPIVQIEGLWGLPEGLYYNNHDKFVVDTKTSKISDGSRAQNLYNVRTKTNFKRNYVAPDSGGHWETRSLCQPFDWRASLTEDECKYIAHHSRRIAEEQGYPVSIMWFVGVPKEIAQEPMIPWYHEQFNPKIGQESITSRTKTKFDRCFVIRSGKDVDMLKSASADQPLLRRIRVQPQEEALLRNKNTLKNIGEAAQKHNAVIVLEGAVLSHAYYQLLQTGAIVEVVHPFVGFEDRIVFNKLVRDKIPEIITNRGERVATLTLNTESHIKALREKLVEEAYELLDARDLDSVVAEMADVEAILHALLKLYRIPRERLTQEVASKFNQRGGFDKGIVLLETESILPTSKAVGDGQLRLTGFDDETVSVPKVGSDELERRTALIDKRIDKHVTPDQVRITAAADIGVTRREWQIDTKEEASGSPRKIISGLVHGERHGSQWKIEIEVQIKDAPPELL